MQPQLLLYFLIWFYQLEDLRSEDIAVCSDDDGLVADVVAKVLLDPLRVEADGRVGGRPKGHIVVLLCPKDEAKREADAKGKGQADDGPRMPSDQMSQPE